MNPLRIDSVSHTIEGHLFQPDSVSRVFPEERCVLPGPPMRDVAPAVASGPWPFPGVLFHMAGRSPSGETP